MENLMQIEENLNPESELWEQCTSEDEKDNFRRKKALADFQQCSIEDICDQYDNCFSYGRAEYLILTDEEADELWEADLDNYIEECIIPELPKHLRFYFDEESWKRDARYDGRGHSLNRYDGNEDEIRITDPEGNKFTFYIFRQN